MKKVSIAIMCYNQEKFIKETIESALNQTYKNIEICISDDCSTDKTYDIILDYQNKYPDIIKCFQQKENMWKFSLCINANSMLNLCTWDYIALLDGDDIMLPNRIERQIHFLEKNHDYIWVSWWVETFQNESGYILWNIHQNLKVNNRTTESLILDWNSIPPCLTFKNILNRPSYNTSLKIMWDWLFYIELSMLWKIWHLNEYLGRYRLHWNNSINKELSLDHILTLDLLDYKYDCHYLSKTNISRCRYYNGRFLKKLRQSKIFAFNILFLSFRIHPFFFFKRIFTSIFK